MSIDGKRGYADLHEHLDTLRKEGLLLTIDRPVDKDSELHPLVRWQYVGGIEEHERKAFLFTNVVDARGRRYKFPVVVGALRRQSPHLLSRHASAGGGRAAALGARDRESDSAAHRRTSGLPGSRDHRRRAERRRQRSRRAADSGLDAGLRQRADADRDERHHRTIPRPAYRTTALIAAASRRRTGWSCAWRRASAAPGGYRHYLKHQKRGDKDDAVRDRARLPAVRRFRGAAEAAARRRRNRRRGRSRGRADPGRAREDGRSPGARPKPRS